jgi:hypothetical protein
MTALFNSVMTMLNDNQCIDENRYIDCLIQYENMQFFLTLDSLCFFAMLLSFITYIAGHQIKTAFFPQYITNLSKNVVDYVEYQKRSLEFFSILGMQVICPPIIITWVEFAYVENQGILPLRSDPGKIFGLLLALWVTHIF